MTDSRTPRPHRPEPIAWGAVEQLAGRAQTIAKGWLLLLLERAPLDAAGAIPAAALAAEGPGLCAAVARGLGSDVELARLTSTGDLAGSLRRLPLLAGARDAAETVAAVEALRACVWETALDGPLDPADAAVVRQFADRLGTVTATVAATALAGVAAEQTASAAPAPPTPVAPEPPAPGPSVARAPYAVGDAGAPPFDAADPGIAEGGDLDGVPLAPPQPLTASNGHLPTAPPAFAPSLHDLRDDAEARDGAGDDRYDGARDPFDGAGHADVTQLPQRPAPDPRQGPAGAMDDSDLWIATLERHIDRCQREGGGLALLRVELVDADRVAASAPEGEAHVPYGRLAQAVRRAIRRQDLVASDHQGRAWVIAPGVGRAGAIALAERIGAGVEHGESWRGAPLSATIGFAVYGEDGLDAAMLIDRAEEAMLAATAAGARIGEAAPHPEDLGGDPDRPGPRLVR
jgi:GGDEF domain-containing protein